MMRSCRLRPALGLALLLSAAPALCGTFTTGAATVSVNTTVSSNCTISATPIIFGSYDPIGANSASGIALTAPGTISLTCLKGGSPTIGLGQGNNFFSGKRDAARSEEHTSELQSRQYLVCRLLLEKKKQ